MKKGKPNSDRKRYSILLHVTGWVILFILPQFLMIGETQWDKRVTQIIMFNTLIYATIFYVNYLWLIPKLLHIKKGIAYVPAAIVFMILMEIGSSSVFRELFPPAEGDKIEHEGAQKNDHHKGERPGQKRFAMYNFYITSILVSGFALGLRYGEEARIREKELKELEREKLKSELTMLKNQISPHFFFNTLNNIYSLIEVNTEDAKISVLNLSKMMRYLLYESEHGNVKLSREIEFMKNYIDLMKLRINKRVRLEVNFPEKYENVDIPPLLFIPFIENAFKHSPSYLGNPFIEIALNVSGSVVTFKSTNSISAGLQEGSPKVDSGIGLENVRKRLSLIFGDSYDLVINQQESVFAVTLMIDTGKAVKA